MRSIFLEGAGWDKENSILIEPALMQLICNMPIIHFQPVEQVRKKAKGENIKVLVDFSSAHKYVHATSNEISILLFSPFLQSFTPVPVIIILREAAIKLGPRLWSQWISNLVHKVPIFG